MGKIKIEVAVICDCGWVGKVIDCEASDDGDLLCPDCYEEGVEEVVSELY